MNVFSISKSLFIYRNGCDTFFCFYKSRFIVYFIVLYYLFLRLFSNLGDIFSGFVKGHCKHRSVQLILIFMYLIQSIANVTFLAGKFFFFFFFLAGKFGIKPRCSGSAFLVALLKQQIFHVLGLRCIRPKRRPR